MNYTEFMNAMLCEIRGQVDAQVRTELYTVTKNNGTRRTGILFKQEDSNLDADSPRSTGNWRNFTRST